MPCMSHNSLSKIYAFKNTNIGSSRANKLYTINPCNFIRILLIKKEIINVGKQVIRLSVPTILHQKKR